MGNVGAVSVGGVGSGKRHPADVKAHRSATEAGPGMNGDRQSAHEAAKSLVRPPQLLVEEWPSKGLVRPQSDYARRFVLPIVGPTTYLLGVALAEAAAGAAGCPVPVPTSQLAESLGLSPSRGPNAPITKSLARLIMFHLAAPKAGTLAVRTSWPLLSHGQHRRLPEWLAHAHAVEIIEITRAHRDPAPVAG